MGFGEGLALSAAVAATVTPVGVLFLYEYFVTTPPVKMAVFSNREHLRNVMMKTVPVMSCRPLS
jgi:hypothetical protein